MVKIKEKLVKLLSIALVGTMPILGVSNIACAMNAPSDTKGGTTSSSQQGPTDDTQQVTIMQLDGGDIDQTSEANVNSRVTNALQETADLTGDDGEEASETMQRRAEEERRIAQLEFELGMANISSPTNEAIVWLERAAEHGHAQAQFCLGENYRFGGMASKALKWYQLAADQGHAGAQRMLAMYYENGEIFPEGK